MTNENGEILVDAPPPAEEPEAGEPESETFSEFTARRRLEESGRADEIRLSAETQAQRMADTLAPVIEKLDAITPNPDEQPRDELGRFASPNPPPPMSDEQARLSQAYAQGRHEVLLQHFGARVQQAMESDPELAEAADKVEIKTDTLYNDLRNAMAQVPNPEDVFRYVAHNPEHLEKVQNTAELYLLVAKISAALEFGTASGRSPEAQTTRAPKPPSPVGKPSGARVGDIHDPNIPWKEYVKLRNAQERRGRSE